METKCVCLLLSDLRSVQNTLQILPCTTLPNVINSGKHVLFSSIDGLIGNFKDSLRALLTARHHKS